jgi:Holliday junction resolvase RusA-like endonuclease
MIRFTIPGVAVGKGRPRVTTINGMARMYTPKKTASYEGLVAHVAQAAMVGKPLVEGAVHIDLTIRCQVPASWSQKKQRMALAGEIIPTTKPDADNVVKAICDGCNGVVWRDDVQAADGAWRKRYAATPGVVVTITPLVVDRQEMLALPAVEKVDELETMF